MIKAVKIKFLGTWHEATMEQTDIYGIGDEQHYVIRKYYLREPLDRQTMYAFEDKVFIEAECEDGYKSEVYAAFAGTLVEKEGRRVEEKAMQKETEEEKVLITKEFYDAEKRSEE